jgi:hypothetical protein
MKKLAFLLLLIFMSGCATPPISYYYGNYSRTLYRSKKDNTPESVAKHVATLHQKKKALSHLRGFVVNMLTYSQRQTIQNPSVSFSLR